VKKVVLKAFIFKKILLILLLLNTSSHAETKEFTYQVYAGGLHVVEAKLSFNVAEPKYAVSVDARTRGWLSSLVPWAGQFKTEGALQQDSFIPSKHQSVSTWRGETETKTFLYENNNLKSLTIEEDNKETVTPEIDLTLTKDTTDLLSATLEVMDHMIKTSECAGESDIFDGRRRFTLYFRDKGQQNLAKSKYNIFSGPARTCTVEIEPKGGHWHKKPRGWLSIQEQGRQKGALPSVWMAKVEGFEYAVPVKILVKTDYGALIMHLTNVK